METFPRNVFGDNGELIFVETEPGLFLSPQRHATEKIVVSEEFRKHAERSRASLNLLKYVGVIIKQWLGNT